MKSKTIVFWFRQDLRLSDNPGLNEAANLGSVLPIYILDDTSAGEFRMGKASRWWLHHSLEKLNEDLDFKLNLYKGDAKEILMALTQEKNIEAVFWNRCYEPWRINRDANIQQDLEKLNVYCKTFNSALLWEPWEITKDDGTPYRIFTSFFRGGCLKACPPRAPHKKPEHLQLIKDKSNPLNLKSLNLLQQHSDHQKYSQYWTVGEKEAIKKLRSFMNAKLVGYKEERNFPALISTSRLSPHLHFGEISPHQIWEDTQKLLILASHEPDVYHFQSELTWREFSYYLLYHFPEITTKNFKEKFNAFPWEHNLSHLKVWKQGTTGYPFVDAGMQELLQTGYMHNRARMITASFLTRNLRTHWHYGRDWFWDCLLDADLANNCVSWQWVAGSGPDPAPYFRIFNPVTQGKKFDPEGKYTRQFIPELKNLPLNYIFAPWEAPQEVLDKAEISLGKDYPFPIVDLQESRASALKAYQKLSM